jgi:hypothetical protein
MFKTLMKDRLRSMGLSVKPLGAGVSGVDLDHDVAAILGRIETRWTFFDVGANVGYFTALGAQLVGATGRIDQVRDPRGEVRVAQVVERGELLGDEHRGEAQDVAQWHQQPPSSGMQPAMQ